MEEGFFSTEERSPAAAIQARDFQDLPLQDLFCRTAALRRAVAPSLSASRGLRRCPSAAWKGRLQVRRAEKEEGWTAWT